MNLCVQESMRLDPPAVDSGLEAVSETVDIYGYTFRSDSAIQINIYSLHHNPEEW